ncbi:2-nitropropane dioxygenase [Marasmius fiardii PR-910]|nr:2-nitropropane dioxygenase [Marasmius fiardii PR-910]
MIPISTRLTKLLGISTPIVLAPMAKLSSVEMVHAITEAGGFGFLGSGADTSEQIVDQLRALRSRFKLQENDVVPVGVGFLGWVLDTTDLTKDPRVEKALSEKPKAIWLAFGDDSFKYVKMVKDFDARRDHRTLIFVIVNSVDDALRAANEWKVDGLIVQGNEAGGHGGANAPSLSILLSAIVEVIPEDGPVLVAAGGIANGRQIASLLTLGASGVALGTRFLLTKECNFIPEKKEMLLAADIHSTTRSIAFDQVNRANEWPKDIDGRAIANKIIDDSEEGLGLEERLKRFDEGAAKKEKGRLVVWAGVGAGLMNEIKSVSEVITELHGGTVEALQRATTLIPT